LQRRAGGKSGARDSLLLFDTALLPFAAYNARLSPPLHSAAGAATTACHVFIRSRTVNLSRAKLLQHLPAWRDLDLRLAYAVTAHARQLLDARGASRAPRLLRFDMPLHHHLRSPPHHCSNVPERTHRCTVSRYTALFRANDTSKV